MTSGGAHPTCQAGRVSAEIILRRVELTLAHTHRAAHGAVADRPTLIVEFRLEPDADEQNLSGWGECPALPEPGYFYEYTDGAQAMLCDVLIPAVVAGGSLQPDAVDQAMSGVPGHPMARSALALAAEDLAARTAGETLASRWSASVDRIPTGAALSLPPPTSPVTATPSPSNGHSGAATDELSERAVSLADLGYRRLKIKVQPGADVGPVSAVARALAEAGHGDVEIAADANASYRIDDPAHEAALSRLDALGLAWLEQPLPADDLVGHARLATRLSTPICLDESVTSQAVVTTALALGFRPLVCVKPARLGGPGPARKLLERCQAEGLDAYVGGMLSSGVGRAADRALAGLPGANRIGDIGSDDQYFSTDLTTPVAADPDGFVSATGRPGLGVDLNLDRLAELTTHEQRWAMP